MKDLTKSTLSAGLALSVFGMQTVLHAFRRSRDGGPNPTIEALDAVTQVIVDRTDDALREAFQAGDKVQREMVDLTFRFLTLAPMNPVDGTSPPSGAAGQAGERVRRWMEEMSSSRPCGDCGASGTPGKETSSPPPADVDPVADGWGAVEE